jgi:hypothetical protein
MKVLYSLFVFVLFFGLWACTSQVPVPQSYPLTYQQKMITAHHWDVLADTVAQRLHDAMASTHPTGETLVLNVQGPRCCTVFNQAFHDLLMTHLLQKGFGITTNPNEGLPIKYQVQLITHEFGPTSTSAESMTSQGSYAAAVPSPSPGDGFNNRSSFYYQDMTSNNVGPSLLVLNTPNTISEVIVTTSLMNGERFVTRMSDIYYVSDDNRDEYAVTAPTPTRLMEVTGR